MYTAFAGLIAGRATSHRFDEHPGFCAWHQTVGGGLPAMAALQALPMYRCCWLHRRVATQHSVLPSTGQGIDDPFIRLGVRLKILINLNINGHWQQPFRTCPTYCREARK